MHQEDTYHADHSTPAIRVHLLKWFAKVHAVNVLESENNHTDDLENDGKLSVDERETHDSTGKKYECRKEVLDSERGRLRLAVTVGSARTGQPEVLKTFQVALLLVLEHVVVDERSVRRVLRETDTVSRHTRPLPNCHQSTVRVFSSPVVKNDGIINESVEFSGKDSDGIEDLMCLLILDSIHSSGDVHSEELVPLDVFVHSENVERERLELHAPYLCQFLFIVSCVFPPSTVPNRNGGF